MSPAEFKKLLDRYFHGECTPEEVAFIEKWYENIASGKSISSSDLEESGSRIWAAVKPSRKLFWHSPFLKVAAAVTLVAVVTAALTLNVLKSETQAPLAQVTVKQYNRQLIEAENTTEQVQNVSLSDGSIVSLEPNSSIRYPRTFASNERIVELTGAAFFNVKRDPSKPFLVYSGEIVTKVLGTSFRITAFDEAEEIVVAVRTGKVSVYPKPAPETSSEIKDVILTPNQQLVYKRNAEVLVKEVVPSPAIVSVDSSSYFKMQFDGMPVTEIFDVLQKNYGIEIRYDQEILAACVLTTTMKEEGFYERIEVICKAINAEYTNTDGAVVITSKGCQ
ncbi:MAG TPA: FecR family protein [Sphingobacteriaceae bacterium]